MAKSGDDKLGFWELCAIGVGGMVGGGIFAVLGLSVQLTRGGAAVAFLLAGLVALATSYSYARLSVACPSEGGTVSFLDRAFGSGLLTGSANILLWISYIVMLSLYAYAFGGYAATFFGPDGQEWWKHVLISAVVACITALNLMSARFIGEAEDWIVLVKLAILFVFIVVGIWGVDASRLSPDAWSPPLMLVAGGMIIFLAYEGFELIANAAGDVRDPGRTLPRAFYASVGFVIVLYVMVAIVTVGSLSPGQIADAKDYALAEAAGPSLGHTGFVLVTIAAMLSTASAINATLYGSARLSYMIARDGELPARLEEKFWGKPAAGLLITAAATLALANLVDLSSLSTMGSAGFLLIFAAVNAANLRLAKQTDSRRWLSFLGMVLCILALGSLIWQTARTEPQRLWILAAMAGGAFLVEAGFRLLTGRTRYFTAHREPRH